MSFQKFKPEVWAAKMLEDLDKKLVFKENCNHDYEGEAKDVGDSVRIPGVGDVPVYEWSDGKLHTLSDPDEVSGNTIFLPINHVAWFHFFVDDLDKRQAHGGEGLMGKYTAKAKNNVATKIDSFIAAMHLKTNLAVGATMSNASDVTAIVPDAFISGGSPTAVQVSASGSGGTKAILDAIDEAQLPLLENDVSRDTKTTLTCPPWFVQMLRRAYVDLDTDNSEMLKNGRVGRYGNIEIKESNNIPHYIDTSGHDVYHLQLKTDDALTFVNPYIWMGAYSPEKKMNTDAVKGYNIFDGRVIYPKQIVDVAVYK